MSVQNSDYQEALELRKVIEVFIQDRRDKKLETLPENETDKRDSVIQTYKRETWLANAAKRACQLQLVTHAAKFVHPDTKTSSIYFTCDGILQNSWIGTHVLKDAREEDVVGNAAALDVYKFLKIKYKEHTLLEYVIKKDALLLAAFSDNAELSQEWMTSFSTLILNNEKPKTDERAKQIYFPLDDESYHLLIPLFPTSLVHSVHNKIKEDLFGDAAKAAREAKKNEKAFPHGYCQYPNLGVQKFGGAKPQNISQLNSQRGGKHWLLASCPPVWKSIAIRPPLKINTIFGKVFSKRPQVVESLKVLKHFLNKTDYNNLNIRNQRAVLIDRIVDEFLQFSGYIQSLNPGWSADKNCNLPDYEKQWLDPARASVDQDFKALMVNSKWIDELSNGFAKWLNQTLRKNKFSVGDQEHTEWEGLLSKRLAEFKMELKDHE